MFTRQLTRVFCVDSIVPLNEVTTRDCSSNSPFFCQVKHLVVTVTTPSLFAETYDLAGEGVIELGIPPSINKHIVDLQNAL